MKRIRSVGVDAGSFCACYASGRSTARRASVSMSTDARFFVFGQVKVSNGSVATPFFLYAAGDTWQHSIQLKVPRRVLN